MQRDASFRELCRNEFPGPRVLRRFRRENRAALHACLVDVLRFELRSQPEANGYRSAEDSVEEEATRRITMAMFIDSMELEET